MPSAVRRSATALAVRCSSNPSSGCMWRSRRNAENSACQPRMWATGFTGRLPLGGDAPLDAEPGVDGIVHEVDDEIDHDKHERNEAQIGRHHRNVREVDSLDEEQSHAGPLEHGL